MANRSLSAEPLEEIALRELCRMGGVSAELVIELVEEGILEPVGQGHSGPLFSAVALRRVQVVRRLQRDLEINRAGAGVVLELLDEVRDLRTRLRVLESQIDDTGR